MERWLRQWLMAKPACPAPMMRVDTSRMRLTPRFWEERLGHRHKDVGRVGDDVEDG